MKTSFKWLKRILSLVVVALLIFAFIGEDPKWLREIALGSLVIQPAFSIGFLVMLALTPIWGRFFCECLCPLGIIQSVVARIVRPRSAVRRVCTRLPMSRAQIVVRSVVFIAFSIALALGYGALAHLITPYSIVGKALVLFMPGLVIFGFVVLSAIFNKGRFWCNWVCPVGSLFTLLSIKSVFPNKISKGCENCRKCFPTDVKKVDSADKPSSDVEVSRRAALKGVAVIAAAHTVEKTTDGGLAAVTLPGIPKRPSNILPPGAVSRSEFNLKCVGCGLCVTKCPMDVLRQSTELKTFGQPEMYFQNGYCRVSCNYKCAQVCPTGALIPRTEARANLHMGHAIWKKDHCLRNATGDKHEFCKACVRNCPVKALHFVDGAVVIDKTACIGCGACEHVCPVRPEPAIIVKGFDRQREVLPMSENDLISEMIALVEAGDSCVLAKNGVIIARDKGRGISPLLRVLDNGKLEGAIVADKIIGRAAAAICVLGGAKVVYANVMSEGAKALLDKHGIKASTAKITDEIINRDKTGICPMEKAVKELTDPSEMVKAIRQTVKEMTK